MQAGSCS